MKWCDLKVGDVLHSELEDASHLVLSVEEGNVFLNLFTGVVSETGVPDSDNEMDSLTWRVDR